MTREERLYNIAQNVVQRLFEHNNINAVLTEAEDKEDDLLSRFRKITYGVEEHEKAAQEKRPPDTKVQKGRPTADIRREYEKFHTGVATGQKVMPKLEIPSLQDDPEYGKFFNFDSKGKLVLSSDPNELNNQLYKLRDFIQYELRLDEENEIFEFLKEEPLYQLDDEIIERIIELPTEPLSTKEQKYLERYLTPEGKFKFSSNALGRMEQLQKLKDYLVAFNYSNEQAQARLESYPFDLTPATIKQILKLPVRTASEKKFVKELAKDAPIKLTSDNLTSIVRYLYSQKMSNAEAKVFLQTKQFSAEDIEKILAAKYNRYAKKDEEGYTGNITTLEKQAQSAVDPSLYGSNVEDLLRQRTGRGRPSLKLVRKGDLPADELRYPGSTGQSVEQIEGEEVNLQGRDADVNSRKYNWEWAIGSIALKFIFNFLREGTSTTVRKELARAIHASTGRLGSKLLLTEITNILVPNSKQHKKIDYGPLNDKITVTLSDGSEVETGTTQNWKDNLPYYAILNYFFDGKFINVVSELTRAEGVEYRANKISSKDVYNSINRKLLEKVVADSKDELETKQTPGKSSAPTFMAAPTRPSTLTQQGADAIINDVVDQLTGYWLKMDKVSEYLVKEYDLDPKGVAYIIYKLKDMYNLRSI